MTRFLLPTLALAAILAAAPASAAMTTGTFITRARALQAQGMTAVLSPDFQTLRGEAQDATQQLRAERAARQAAGKKPIACVPEGQSIGILEMLDGLDALSPAEKKLPLKDGYAHVLAKRFPCR
jgi:hypothetical protein